MFLTQKQSWNLCTHSLSLFSMLNSSPVLTTYPLTKLICSVLVHLTKHLCKSHQHTLPYYAYVNIFRNSFMAYVMKTVLQKAVLTGIFCP